MQACIGFIIKLFSPSPSRLLTDLAWCCGENEGGMVGMVGSGTPAATPAAAAAATCRMPIAKTEGHSQPEDRQESQDGITEQNRTGQDRGISPVAHLGRLASVRALRGLALPCHQRSAASDCFSIPSFPMIPIPSQPPRVLGSPPRPWLAINPSMDALC